MTNIQDQFNATKSGDFVLAPGEYEEIGRASCKERVFSTV